MHSKSQIWVSAILYVMIVTVVMVLVLNAGIPILRNLEDKTVFTRSKNTFLTLNQHITDVSEEGIGSQRVIPIEIEKGYVEVKDGALKWDLKTDAKILESGQQIELGNLYISSNADVTASDYAANYTIENTYLRVAFHKCEDDSVCTFNESGFMKDNQPVFKNPETGAETSASNQFQFDFGLGAWNYSGYSVLEDEGSSLGAARVLYYINNTNSSYYTVVEFLLESNRDFIQVRIR